MKYIIVEKYGIPVAIIFDEILSHDEVALGQKILSAGLTSSNLECVWGKSVSLEIGSRPEDAIILMQSAARRI